MHPKMTMEARKRRVCRTMGKCIICNTHTYKHVIVKLCDDCILYEYYVCFKARKPPTSCGRHVQKVARLLQTATFHSNNANGLVLYHVTRPCKSVRLSFCSMNSPPSYQASIDLVTYDSYIIMKNQVMLICLQNLKTGTRHLPLAQD